MVTQLYWHKIDKDNPTTLPECDISVLILSEEGYFSVEKRNKGEDFIYSDTTDSGCAVAWAYLDYDELFKLLK